MCGAFLSFAQTLRSSTCCKLTEWLLLSVRVLAVLLCIITVRLTPIVLPVLAPEGYVAPPTLLVKTIVQFFLCSLLAILCSSHILWLLTSVRDIKIAALAFHCV